MWNIWTCSMEFLAEMSREVLKMHNKLKMCESWTSDPLFNEEHSQWISWKVSKVRMKKSNSNNIPTELNIFMIEWSLKMWKEFRCVKRGRLMKNFVHEKYIQPKYNKYLRDVLLCFSTTLKVCFFQFDPKKKTTKYQWRNAEIREYHWQTT